MIHFLLKFIFNTKVILFNYLRIIFNFFVGTETCLICNSKSYNYPLCRTCIRKELILNFDYSERCKICSKPLLSEINTCTECRENRILLSCDYIFCIYTYRLWKKNLLFAWKMEEKRSLSYLFSMIINSVLKNNQNFIGEKFIVPVPPRKNKIKNKGWDQIDDLCNFLSLKYNYKVLKFLERINLNQQKKLNREERLNVRGKSYSLSSYFYKYKKKNLLPSSVILIDDVLTTGITIEECSKLLKGAGIKNVKALTLFIVD